MKNEWLSIAFAKDLMSRYQRAEDYPYRSWSYPQGYLLMGMTHLFELTGEVAYYDYIYEYCDFHVTEEGDILGFTGCSMDDMMPGAILVWMYEKTKEERFAEACRKIREAFRDYPRTREGGFLHDRFRYPGEMWVDGVFMGQMFLCRYGRIFQEQECFEEGIRQLELIHQYCFRTKGLLVHGYSEDSLAAWAGTGGQSQEVWSEGLGWYALILSQMCDIFPEKYHKKKVAEGYLKELLGALKEVQNPRNGLWHQIVDRPDLPGNWCDTSGSAMFLYAFARALQSGLISAKDYEETTQRAYDGLKKRMIRNPATHHLDIVGACNGLCVQSTTEAYLNYPQTVNAQEAMCSFLWGMEKMEEYMYGEDA